MLASHHVSATTPIRVAATGRVRDVLAGRVRAATVVHAGHDAVYLDVDGFCLGVLSRSATAVPCGLRTTLTSLAEGLATPTPPGSRARVGGGSLLLGGARLTVGRVVEASVPPLPPAAARRAARTLAKVFPPLPHTREELPAAALTLLGDGDPAAVPLLLGRGSGLTPLGDDVLCGWLATVAAGVLGGHDPARLRPVAAAVTALASRNTTTLSATLLDCAARGEALPRFRRLVAELASAGPGCAAGLAALLEVGHTSGHGLVLGLHLALDLLQRFPTERTLV